MKTEISIFVIFLISIFIFSCGKKEEIGEEGDTCFTTTTASGTINFGSESLSGVYGSVCSNDTSNYPSDTNGAMEAFVVTGENAYSWEIHLFSDNSCETLTAYLKIENSNLVVGERSGSNYKVTHSQNKAKGLANTEITKSALESILGTSITLGTEASIDIGGNYKNLMSVSSNTIRVGSPDSDNYPTSISGPEMTKKCQ